MKCITEQLKAFVLIKLVMPRWIALCLLFLFIFNFFEKRRLDLIVDNGLPDANFKRRCSWFDVTDVDAALRREEDLVIVAQRVDADVELFGLTKLL